MISLHEVTKRYRTSAGVHTVLDSVSIVFPKNKNIGILGLNGAGKSTLIRIIGNAEDPDSGYVKRTSHISWPMGFSGGFQSNLTARENARFVARIYGEDPRYVEAFAEEFAELGKYFDVPLRNYSAGMRSRFAVSVSLACDFEYYLVDEGLETGDARYREKVRLAFEERQAQAAVILVSHNEQTIRRTCDAAAILRGGKLDYFEDIKMALQEYRQMQEQAA